MFAHNRMSHYSAPSVPQPVRRPVIVQPTIRADVAYIAAGPRAARLAAWLVIVLIALTPAANAKDPAANANSTIIYYDMAGNETLDPTEPQNNSSYSHEALRAIYDPLIRLNDAGVPAPGLANSWTRNEDLTEFTLQLRRGVTFRDGAPFNAEAVKRNFERSASLGRRAGNTVAETFGLISAMEFVGDDIVKLKLRVPNGQIEYWLGSTSGMMISPAAIKEGAFRRQPNSDRRWTVQAQVLRSQRDEWPSGGIRAPLRAGSACAAERPEVRSGQRLADRCAAVAVMQDLAREISDTAATIPIITRANLYASRPGCILNLQPYCRPAMTGSMTSVSPRGATDV